jgi:putative ABC transport system permease protein
VTPPHFALFLLDRLLPRQWREVIAGDLEEEWYVSARRSRLRFWNLALRSIAACWIDRLRQRWHGRHVYAPPATGGHAMRSVLYDLRYGWRLMARSPGFTLTTVLTLGLGIGLNAAIFGVLNWISLAPLPYHEPARLAFLIGWDVEEDETRFNLRLADYLDLQRDSRSLQSIAAYSYLTANLTGGDVPERVQAYRVTANTFALLGVPAALGRTFGQTDAGRDNVAVISHDLWQRRFGGDPAVVGRTVTLNGSASEIVGIMPPWFEFPIFNFKGDVWMPLATGEGIRGQAAATESVTVIGRLQQGASLTSAQAETATLMWSYAAAYPATNRSLGVRLVEMGKLDEQNIGPILPILMTTVAVVLALACANVANLLLARGVSRQRELAVRAAMGASRIRIGRQLLVESMLLALAGGGVGLVVAQVALSALRDTLPEVVLLTQPNLDAIGLDRTALAYTFAISLLTSLAFGLVPAWRAARHGSHEGLKESAASGGGRGTRRLRTALVVAEVALATLLLVAGGLLARSSLGLRRVDPGFNPAGVLTMALTLPDHQYPDLPQRTRFYEQALQRIARLPGVVSTGLVNTLPFSTYDRGTRLRVEGAPPLEPGREPLIAYRVSSPQYFDALRIPVVEGRRFDARDTGDAPRVAIVNRALARRFFDERSPVGRRVQLGAGADAPRLAIVGVIGDVRHHQLNQAPDPEIHLPMAQAAPAMMMLAVRSEQPPDDLAGPVRAAIQAIDAAQPVYHVKTLGQLVAESMLPRTVSAVLMLAFSALALVLAAIGVSGVVAYGVRQQAREFGVRLALGATPRDLQALVLRSGLRMVGLGLGLGLAGAFVVSRLMAGVLYGVSPADPLTYAAVVGVLGATGLLACSVPAWRASRTQPITALRGMDVH